MQWRPGRGKPFGDPGRKRINRKEPWSGKNGRNRMRIGGKAEDPLVRERHYTPKIPIYELKANRKCMDNRYLRNALAMPETRRTMFRLRRRISAVLITGAFATLFAGWLCLERYIPQGGYFEFTRNPIMGMSRFRGFGAGMIAAARDLEKNRAVRATYGDWLLTLHRPSGLDTITLGCVTDDGLRAYVAGYNDLVDLFIKWRGIPRNSRKQWEYILEDSNLYFDKQARNEAPLTLVPDGPPTKLPGSRAVASVSALKRGESRIVAYELRWGTRDPLLLFVLPIENVFTCLPGPNGSDFLLIRGQRFGRARTLVYDLRYRSEISIEKKNIP